MQGLLTDMKIDPRSTIYYKLLGKTLKDDLVLLGEGDQEILTMFKKCKEDPVIYIYITVVEEVTSPDLVHIEEVTSPDCESDDDEALFKEVEE